MNNFKAKGDVLTLPAPYDVASGEAFIVGAIFGVAQKAAKNGDPVATVTKGVFIGPKATGAAWIVGDVLYWDATAKAYTKTAGSNTRVGVAVQSAQAGDVTGSVKINGATL